MGDLEKFMHDEDLQLPDLIKNSVISSIYALERAIKCINPQLNPQKSCFYIPIKY